MKESKLEDVAEKLQQLEDSELDKLMLFGPKGVIKHESEKELLNKAYSDFVSYESKRRGTIEIASVDNEAYQLVARTIIDKADPLLIQEIKDYQLSTCKLLYHPRN